MTELIVFTGLQASGKTSFYRERFAATHVHISKDAWPNARKKEERQRRLIDEHLRAGRSVVVDNTNPTTAERLPLIAIGRAVGARVVSYAFIVRVEEALCRNATREGRARIADVGIFSVAKQLVLPTQTEDFDERFEVRLADARFVVVPFSVENDCQTGLIQTVPEIMSRARKRRIQLTLDQGRKPVGHGGWRPNAGRSRGRKVVPHDARPHHRARNPVHATLRLCSDAPAIAREWLMKTIHAAIHDSHKDGFHIVEFNVLSNHIHFLVEAATTVALSRGMQGFAGRLALRLNRRLKRTGKLFATRFHARPLTTPRDVRNTLCYVLQNRKHHDTTTRFDRYWIDPHSSAAWFDGWAEPIRGAHWKQELAARPAPTRRATTWLLATGWRRRGLLRFDKAPSQR